MHRPEVPTDSWCFQCVVQVVNSGADLKLPVVFIVVILDVDGANQILTLPRPWQRVTDEWKPWCGLVLEPEPQRTDFKRALTPMATRSSREAVDRGSEPCVGWQWHCQAWWTSLTTTMHLQTGLGVHVGRTHLEGVGN